jgi:carboxypeptidase Q
MKNSTFSNFIFSVFICIPILAQDANDELAKINTEGFQKSEVMQIITDLTDLYGPRLTGTHGYYRAAEWAKKSLEGWGLDKVILEPYCDDCMGWEVKSFNVEMTAPTYMKIEAYPYAWTESSGGNKTADLIWIEDYKNMEKVKESWKGKLEGKTVLIGKTPKQNLLFDPLSQRFSEETLSEAEKSILPVTENSLGPSIGDRSLPEILNLFEKFTGSDNFFFKFLKEEGAVGVLGTTAFFPGILHPSGTYNNRESNEKSIPYFAIAPEDFGKLKRLIERDIAPRISFHLDSELYLEKKNNVNIIGEITGSDPKLKNEVVMIGAHFDSWHSSSGATDNGAGSAVMMEVMRIFKELGIQPRRTLRIALWGAEEQGLVGSRDYVKTHFADPATMELKPDYENLSAYFNLDNGTGRVRGIWLEGNLGVKPVFEQWIEPLHDLGVTTIGPREVRGTDHGSFDAVGLPGFQFMQDRVEYRARTHHSNMDVYDRVQAEDMVVTATVAAVFAYNAAMRDERLPREAMPKPRTR